MYDAVVEVNDVNLPIWQNGERYNCPAFALLDSNGLQFGASARDQARMYPLRINNRFIQQLSLVETPELKPHARHHADLCYRFIQFAHQQAQQPERCVFVIPASYTQENMSVLLGVVKQCQFDAVGLVDQTVAVASQCAEKTAGVYCDLQLHQLVLGAYHIVDGEVTRGASQTVEQFGQLALYERWIRILAQAFITQCRFDPLHDASTEQLLWEQLPTILSSQPQNDLYNVSLFNKHLVEIPSATMMQPVEALFNQLQKRVTSLETEVGELLCSDRLALLPGLMGKDSRMRAVDSNAIASAINECQTLICSNTSNLPFISALPASGYQQASGDVIAPAGAKQAQTATPPTAIISHFLVDGTAYPLRKRSLYLNSLGEAIVWSQREGSVAVAIATEADGKWRLQGVGQTKVWHNNTVLTGDAISLSKGDRIKFSEQGAELCFIQLSEESSV